MCLSALGTWYNSTTPSLPLTRYAVLALGSTLYREFGKFGKDIDEFLASRGATAICPLQEADEMRGQDAAYKKWAGRVLQHYTKGDSKVKVQEEKVLRYRFVNREQTTPTQEGMYHT